MQAYYKGRNNTWDIVKYNMDMDHACVGLASEARVQCANGALVSAENRGGGHYIRINQNIHFVSHKLAQALDGSVDGARTGKRDVSGASYDQGRMINDRFNSYEIHLALLNAMRDPTIIDFNGIQSDRAVFKMFDKGLQGELTLSLQPIFKISDGVDHLVGVPSIQFACYSYQHIKTKDAERCEAYDPFSLAIVLANGGISATDHYKKVCKAYNNCNLLYKSGDYIFAFKPLTYVNHNPLGFIEYYTHLRNSQYINKLLLMKKSELEKNRPNPEPDGGTQYDMEMAKILNQMREDLEKENKALEKEKRISFNKLHLCKYARPVPIYKIKKDSDLSKIADGVVTECLLDYYDDLSKVANGVVKKCLVDYYNEGHLFLSKNARRFMLRITDTPNANEDTRVPQQFFTVDYGNDEDQSTVSCEEFYVRGSIKDNIYMDAIKCPDPGHLISYRDWVDKYDACPEQVDERSDDDLGLIYTSLEGGRVFADQHGWLYKDRSGHVVQSSVALADQAYGLGQAHER